MEASALTHAQKRGIFSRRSPLLKLQGDENLVALTRKGHQHAFDAIVERYQARLLGFCRQMLGSTEDAEDVLQEVFVAAYRAMVADERPIAVRPWLYRIARNRSLNHLRKPTADGQDTMDTHPHMNGVTTLERVQNREEFRNLLDDVSHLPETQRSALLLREIDAMSYEEIAQAMDTTVPGIKSLLVRARIALAESSQARQLTCDEVRLQLAEAAEGLAKLDGAGRRHVKGCDSCSDFRDQLRKDKKVLAALFPAGPLLALKGLLIGKLTGLIGGGGGGAAGGAAAGGAGAAVAGAGAAGGTAATGAAVGGAAAVGGGAASGAGAAGAAAAGAGAAISTKAAAGLATAALLAGGAAEVKHLAATDKDPTPKPAAKAEAAAQPAPEPPVAAPPPPAVAPAPTTPAPAAQPTEVVVEPVPEGEETVLDEATGGLLGPKTRKRRKDEAIADVDGSPTTTTPAPPVATEIQQSCSTDVDGDGVADAGCGGTTATIVQVAPPLPTPKSDKGKNKSKRRSAGGKAPKKKSASKRSKKRR